ncbi:molybdate ABC transporter permease subunit [Desulfovibrio aminophilus]|nr:molybdate ABC transporter permease subunit [Desulfovibrio aminophilus]MCM0756163.1 molybdate ABC transporter permease subunit [Desulfovibrio aminophilus]
MAIWSALAGEGALGPIWLSLRVALVSLPLFAVSGVALGWLLARRRNRLTAALDFLVSLPLVFPPIATGFLLLLALGRRSPVGHALESVFGLELIFSFWGVTLASFVAGLPLAVKPVQTAIRAETLQLVDAAYVLGKSPLTTFFRVVLPNIRSSVLVAVFLAFGRSLGEVGVTLMLGGNIVGKTNTVSLEIYNAVFTGDYDRALALTALLGGCSLGMLWLVRRAGGVARDGNGR